jgi:hypothetical protein
LSGAVKGGFAIAPSLELGPIRSDNVRVVIDDLSFVQEAFPFRIDGILGLDVLGQSTFAIDYSSREILFGAAPSMPNSAPLQVKDGLAYVDAVFNRNPVRLLVDTGASSLVIFNNLAGAGSGKNGNAAQPLAKRIDGSNRKRVAQTSLRLGEVEFGKGTVSLVPNHRDAEHDFDGLMSPAALGITRIALDLNRRTLAFAQE